MKMSTEILQNNQAAALKPRKALNNLLNSPNSKQNVNIINQNIKKVKLN
jgi:hypothetical protein